MSKYFTNAEKMTKITGLYKKMKARDYIEKFKKGQIGIIPTDTIYGVTASAWSEQAVKRAYEICRRNPKKPFVILIGSMKDLALFKIKIDTKTRKIIKKIWPGKVSVILPVTPKKFGYLHRNTKSLAFRLPKKKSLANLLKKTGPMISTSANHQGKKPAKTVAEAKNYFGEKIDFYVSSGKIKSLPSTLVEIKEGKIHVLRKGAVKIQRN